VHAWRSSDTDRLIAQTRHYDAFEDLPWAVVYPDMAKRFPDARFILSQRADETKWLKSMRRHVERSEWMGYKWFYGVGKVNWNERVVLESYRNHTIAVREFFRDQPDRLLELRIDAGNAPWTSLCGFLELDVPTIPFPRSNSAESWKEGQLQGKLSTGWLDVLSCFEEWFAFLAYRTKSKTPGKALSLCRHVILGTEQAVVNCLWRLRTVMSGRTSR